jgi:hypothetical protein
METFFSFLLMCKFYDRQEISKKILIFMPSELGDGRMTKVKIKSQNVSIKKIRYVTQFYHVTRRDIS